jgi:hypothetical protein
MKTRFLITTAVGVVFATTAFAQSPSSTTSSPSIPQTQAPTTSSPASQKAPETSTQAPAPSASSSTTTTSPTTASPQAQTVAPASSSGNSASQPAQAQTQPPATSQTQQTSPARSQAQHTPGGTNANEAAKPAQPSTATNIAQPSSGNVNASVSINDQQRTRVTESITRLKVQPLNSVDFSLNVGTPIPRDVRLQTLPSDVVEVVPQYRGYGFFMVRDEIVIVEPSTNQIVTVLPRAGGSTVAAAPAPARLKVAFTDKDREVVRKHTKTRTTERQTTGSTAKVEIRRDERVPDSVELEEFPETVYREAPSLREYRYVHRENRTYLIDPGERRVIEEIE